MVKHLENSGIEETGLVTPTPDPHSNIYCYT